MSASLVAAMIVGAKFTRPTGFAILQSSANGLTRTQAQQQPMRRFIYRGNFCTECGNPLAKPSGWWPRVFCADCATQLRRSQRLPGKGWAWLFALFIAALFYTLNHSSAQPTPTPPPLQQFATNNSTPAAVSLPTETPETAAAFCGARTRKGTPCRRLVKAGQRCAQHRGKPSLLKPEPIESTTQ